MTNKINLNILLIEDNTADAFFFEDMITECRKPCNLRIANSLSAAFSQIHEMRFDAVLLDLNLPDSSGIETLHKVQVQAPDLPVIILTGFADEQLARQAISLGAQDYLFKGKINSDLMSRSVLYAIERKQVANQLRRSKELSDAINRINSLIFSTLDFDEIMNRVMEESTRATGADAATIYFPDGDDWVAKYVYGLEGLAGRHVSEKDIKYSLLAVKERHPILINNVPGNDEMCRLRIVQEFGVKALLDAPLLTVGGSVGDFALYSCKKTDVFQEEHKEFINKVSSSVALAVENAQLFQSLRDSEARLRGIAASAQDAVILINNEGNVSFWNDAATRIFGYTGGEMIGQYLHSFIVPDRHVAQFKAGFEMFQTTGTGKFIGTTYEIEARRKDGMELPVELSLSAVMLKGKWCAVGIVRDITERKRAQEALRESEERNRAMIKASSQVIYRMSPDWSEMRALKGGGFIADTDTPNRNWMQEYIHPDDQNWVLELIGQSVRTGKIFELEHRVRRIDGSLGWTFSRAIPVRNAAGEIIEWFGAASDITERKRMEQEIMHMAEHDALTGLPNRRLFVDLLKLEIAQARRHRRRLGILFLDLDRFKEINDTLGHMVGDELLKKVSVRLKEAIRESDTVARIGGDEFNIILADIENAEAISEIARKIMDRLRLPFSVEGHDLLVSTSIGISIYPDDGQDIDTLLRYADIAMYHAKEKGRNNYQFYNKAINSTTVALMQFENELVRAIERDEFRLYFQPLVKIISGEILSAEALLRWQHPERGLLLPEQFLGIAERIGFMSEIDDWVLKTVAEQISEWLKKGITPTCINVNMSPAQFDREDLIEIVTDVLKRTGMPPDCLNIEITETMAMRNIGRTVGRLQELKELGVVISIDDFGTGYSSLSQLKRLPVRKIKIDKSFVNDITINRDNRTIVTALLNMAHLMDIGVVAEGVENRYQLSFLRDLKCDEAQGNFFSEPLPAADFEALVSSQ